MISVIIPASNEAALIGRCLRSVFADPAPDGAEVIVVANGCRDDTVKKARAMTGDAEKAGWGLTVLDLPEGGKPGALNAGDGAARHGARVYLDADIVVDPGLMAQLAKVLVTDAPLYASGQMRIAPAHSIATKAYARIYRQVPFMTKGVPGAGLFGVSAAGRARWGAFPQIISDDTYARLQFSSSERTAVAAGYDWPLVEGFGNLVRVRRRQNDGVAEIAELYPALMKNDEKPQLTLAQKSTLFLRDPLGFMVYAGVALATRLPTRGGDVWRRGR